jgi:hypothetical protein
MIGFSLPVGGDIAVISYEGVHIVPIAHPETIAHHPELPEGGDAYNTKSQRLELAGRTFPVLGLHGGTPRLETKLGERVAFGAGDWFVVIDPAGREVFRHSYTDMSGDWRVVTFTPDDRFILFGVPYELEIFRRDSAD